MPRAILLKLPKKEKKKANRKHLLMCFAAAWNKQIRNFSENLQKKV